MTGGRLFLKVLAALGIVSGAAVPVEHFLQGRPGACIAFAVQMFLSGIILGMFFVRLLYTPGKPTRGRHAE